MAEVIPFDATKADGKCVYCGAAHYALAAKFRRDWQGQTNDFAYPDEWAAMDKQVGVL